MIDLSYIYHVADNNREFVLDLLGALKKNLEDFPTQMRKDFDANNWAALRATAHKFKSSVSYSGMEALIEALIKLETLADAESNESQTVDSLRTVFRSAAVMHATVLAEIEQAKLLPVDAD
jgi:HPt (histidine-containing phosphotransfer) domain-containing protein